MTRKMEDMTMINLVIEGTTGSSNRRYYNLVIAGTTGDSSFYLYYGVINKDVFFSP